MAHSRSGFSLMEIMIAIAIISLMLGVAGPFLMKQYQKAKVSKARTELRGIQDAINQFNIDTNRNPSSLKDLVKRPTDENLARRWDGPYLKQKTVPQDPWGNKYKYQLTPDAQHPYELSSRGPAGGGKKSAMSVWDED